MRDWAYVMRECPHARVALKEFLDEYACAPRNVGAVVRYLRENEFDEQEVFAIMYPLAVSERAATYCAIYYNGEEWWDAMRDGPVDDDWFYFNCPDCGLERTECRAKMRV